jgi:hypothetical protein
MRNIVWTAVLAVALAGASIWAAFVLTPAVSLALGVAAIVSAVLSLRD